MLEQVCPILPSRDFAVTEAFYRKLGFESWYNDTEYMLMNRDRVEIHFVHRPAHQPEAGHWAYIRPADVDVLSAEITALDLGIRGEVPHFTPAEDKPWGMREAVICDPDGNVLRIGQEVARG